MIAQGSSRTRRGARPAHSLRYDEVHLWRVRSPERVAMAAWAWHLLGPLEKRRAGRFVLASDCARYVLRWASIRGVLAAYVGAAPGDLRIGTTAWGKPVLYERGRPSRLQFSVSHSGDLTLVAVARLRRVGVDLECASPADTIERVAPRFLGPAELQRLSALRRRSRLAAILTSWTCKEAYLKALGRGLTIPATSVYVVLDPGPRVVQWMASATGISPRWHLRVLRPGRGYVAALAVSGGPYRLRYWTWGGRTSARY